jgi:hypothetical protein
MRDATISGVSTRSVQARLLDTSQLGGKKVLLGVIDLSDMNAPNGDLTDWTTAPDRDRLAALQSKVVSPRLLVLVLLFCFAMFIRFSLFHCYYSEKGIFLRSMTVPTVTVNWPLHSAQ